jgi:MFS family permease
VNENLNPVLAVQALRAGLYGFGAVVIGEVLAIRGYSPLQVGLVLTALVAGMGLSSLLVGVIGPRLSSRALYVGLLLVMGLSGLVFAITVWLPALVIAGLTGTISTDPNESGPITTVEQGLIGRADAERRLRLFGRYNAVAYLAGSVGALAAAGASLLQRSGSLQSAPQILFLAFPIVALACAGIASRIRGSGSDLSTDTARPATRPSGKILQLSSLFAVDAFGGGFVTQAFVAYWLHFKFGVGPETVGVVFFVSGLLQAASSVLVARLAARVGVSMRWCSPTSHRTCSWLQSPSRPHSEWPSPCSCAGSRSRKWTSRRDRLLSPAWSSPRIGSGPLPTPILPATLPGRLDRR